MLGGALAGGRWSDRSGRRRVAAACVVALAVLVGLVALLAGRPTAALAALIATYAGIGLLTAASYALFMDLTDRRLGATQFSTYMAATNACEAWAGFTVGRLAGTVGYAGAFVALAAVSLAALLPLRALGDARPTSPPGAPRA
jgi:MFS family permease